LAEFGVTAFATTELTLMPCTIDFESQTPTVVTLQFGIWDDTELFQSLSTTLECWFNEDLSDLASAWNPVRSTTYQTQVRPSTGNRCRGGDPTLEFKLCTDDNQCGGGVCASSSAVLGVAETFRVLPGPVLSGSSAINLHGIGLHDNDTIFLQSGTLGTCVGGPNDNNPCTTDAECAPGTCE